ncbi:trypsin-like serine peptidase, partial [Rhizobium brockwellii]
EQHLCTGTLISPNTVLTAGHCIHSGTRTGEPYQNFRIFPGRNLGAAPFGRCLGVNAFILSGWSSSATPDESRYYDLGAIKLNCNVGETTGWLGVRTIGDDESIDTIVQGYAADRAPTGRQWTSEDKLRI